MTRWMTAPRFDGNGVITWQQREVTEPGEGQLLMRVGANSLCGSDRHQYLHGTDVVPGHEAAGIVEVAGPGTAIAPGTRGVVFLMEFCGACRNCRAGWTNLCLAKRADIGFTHDGGFGEYMVVAESIFFPVDDDLSYADATLLLDVMGTGGHAVDRARLVQPQIESLLVCGAGPIGLGVIAMANTILGPDVPVFVTDFVGLRLELAPKLGATPINLAEADLPESLAAAGFPLVDCAIDTSGKSVARRLALDVLAKPGALVCVGHGEELLVDISRDLIAPEHALLGSEYFPFADLTTNAARLRERPDYFRQIITHVLDVESLSHAYDLFFGGSTGKVIVTHDI